MKKQEAIRLERAAFPEEVGVDSRAIRAFVREIESMGVESHSLMILRHGKVAFETWKTPYAPHLPHTMYSISKSVTATAIGFAFAEGLLARDTKVIDIFPEYRPKREDPWLDKMTVRHLLSMSAGKDVSVLSNKAMGHWVRSFFHSPWAFEPGTDFKYISENTYMLCAILHRVTGQSVREYLWPRLFEPLGFDRIPFWETDENGVEAGGWGIYLTTEELAKIVLCYQQGGMFQGIRVLPEGWVEEATSKQVNSDVPRAKPDPDSSAGYGYCFWRNHIPDSYRFDGMFTQQGIVFSKYDAIIILTMSEVDESKPRKCLWKYFPQGFLSKNAAMPKADAAQIRFAPLPPHPAAPRNTVLEQRIDGREIRFFPFHLANFIGFPMSVLSLAAVYMSANKAGHINRVVLCFQPDTCTMQWREGPEKNCVTCGMDGSYRTSRMRLGDIALTAISSAAWLDENTLEISIRPIETVCARKMRFAFRGNRVTMRPTCVPDMKGVAENLAETLGDFLKNPLLLKTAQLILLHGYRLLEPKHRGRIR